jgi:hypothetical protein
VAKLWKVSLNRRPFQCLSRGEMQARLREVPSPIILSLSFQIEVSEVFKVLALLVKIQHLFSSISHYQTDGFCTERLKIIVVRTS